MLQRKLEQFRNIIHLTPIKLRKLGEVEMNYKPSPNKWSKKEILGHLIDSAANNHQRFVRGQFEETPSIKYDQNEWNAFSYYQDRDTELLISFWELYNRQILDIIVRIAPEHLNNKVQVGDELHTLKFLIVDYVDHLQHHFKQIFDEKVISKTI